MSFYSDLQGVAAGVLAEFKQGTVLLIRSTPGDDISAAEPGPVTETTYELDAAVRGVSAKHVDGTLILASDLLVTCSVMATNQSTLVKAEITPVLQDRIVINGTPRVVKKIEAKPAAGTVVAYQIFVEG